MALLSRIVRLFKADIHGVLDQIEDQGLLLKQHLRDMEEALVEREMKLKKMRWALAKIRQVRQKREKQAADLEQDLNVAIQKDREDIARMLIKKLRPLTRIQTERCNHIDRLNYEIGQLSAHTEQQRIQYKQLCQKATQYFHRKDLQTRDPMWPTTQPGFEFHEPGEEEVELELLQRKEALKGGSLR